MDSSAKIVKPRLLHGSQWGYIDPVDTPDGGNVGFHKHLAISTKITTTIPQKHLINWLKNVGDMKLLMEISLDSILNNTKIFVNGYWVGIHNSPIELKKIFLYYRRIGCIPIMISISWSYPDNIIYFYTDAGRLIRPVFYIEDEERICSLEYYNETYNSLSDLLYGSTKRKKKNK